MGLRCCVCDHLKIVEINKGLADGSLSIRDVEGRYKLPRSSVGRHAKDHLPAVVERAAARQRAIKDDQFMDAIQLLMRESQQYVADAHGAVKVQCVGKNEYKEYRDVGAMAAAINSAKGVTELLGNATGRLANVAAGVTVNNYLAVAMPRPEDTAPPAIEATCSPMQLDDPETTDR